MFFRDRDIKSEPPIACANGKYECYVPTGGITFDGAKYKCKLCNKQFIFYIPSHKSDGSWDHQRTGWYLLNDSAWDIIKSWFRLKGV